MSSARLELALRADICPCRGDKKKRRVWGAQFDKSHSHVHPNSGRSSKLDLDKLIWDEFWTAGIDLSVDDKWDEVNWIKRSS